MSRSDFKQQQARIVHDFEHDKAYFEWLRLPMWERYEQDRQNWDYSGWDDDHTPSYPTHEELERLTGCKLINLEEEGIIY